MLPDISLPANTAAAIYLSTAQDVAEAASSGGTPNFRFLGAIGPGKESAMFKVGATAVSKASSQGGLMVGVSVEPEESIGSRLQELAANKASTSTSGDQTSTVALAQRIIENAFNFLSSFSGQAGPGGVEVVPLKAFENWWRKFESRVRADPSFLEKPSD